LTTTGPKRPPLATRELVRELLAEGTPRAEIAGLLGIARTTVCYHARMLGLSPDERFARRYDWPEIRRYYERGYSARQCRERFGFTRSAWEAAVARGNIELRPTALPIGDLLVSGPKRNRGHVKGRVLAAGLKMNRCEGCGLSQWRNQPLALQLHHVNGHGHDNRLENLHLLCPNCHSQTETWGGRNVSRKGAADDRPKAA
jgi:hypothetical protein